MSGNVAIPVPRPASTTQGVIFLSLANAALLVFGYAAHVVGSRVLTPADYGRFVVAISASNWLKVVLAALIVPGMAKIVSEDHRRLRVALDTGGRWQWGAALVTAAAALAASPFIARAVGDRALVPLLIVVALEIPFFAGVSMGRHLLTAIRRYARAAATLTAYSIVRAVAACVLILMGAGAVGGTIGLALGSVVGGATGVFLLRDMSVRLPSAPYPPLVRRSLSWTALTLPAGLALVTLTNMDMWMVKGLMSDPAVAGIYGAAFAASRLPDVMLQGLMGAVFARVSEALAQGKQALARSVSEEALRFVLVLSVPVCALTASSSSEIMALAFGARYAAAGSWLTLLMAAIAFSGALKVMLTLLSAADRPGQRMMFALALLPVGLALNLVLIPRYGPAGAAWASLGTMALGAAAGGFFVHHFLGAAPPPWTVIRCGLAGLAVYALGRVWPAAGWLLVGKLAALGLLYLVLLLALKEVRAYEIRWFRQAMLPENPQPPVSDE